MKYAVGEILLIGIGILIALQLNNWNDARKKQREFQNILRIIGNDLAKDTAKAAELVQFYERRKPLYLQVMADTFSVNGARSCREYNYLAVGVRGMPVEKRLPAFAGVRKPFGIGPRLPHC